MSLNQTSHDVVLSADNPVTEVQAEKVIDSTSVQPVDHTSVSSSLSMVLESQSVKKSNAWSKPVCTFSKVVTRLGT